MQLTAVSLIFQCTESLHSSYWSQGGLWRPEDRLTCSAQNSHSTCPTRAIALLCLPRFLVRSMLNSQLMFFVPVSNYLTLYCCFYRHLNPCRETDPHKILYGSAMRMCSGITSEQCWLTKQQHAQTIPYTEEVFKVVHRINCVFFFFS